jgi:hypothetical protein
LVHLKGPKGCNRNFDSYKTDFQNGQIKWVS